MSSMLAFAIPSPSALHSLKGIKVNWYKPLPVEKVVYLLDEYQLVNSRFWGLTWRNREQIWIMLFVIKSWKRVFLGYIVLFPVVYAELRGPIFLVTSTTGEDQDLFDSFITPLSNIFRTSSLFSSCFAKSSLRGPWGLGWASQVFIRCPRGKNICGAYRYVMIGINWSTRNHIFLVVVRWLNHAKGKSGSDFYWTSMAANQIRF